MKFLFLSFLFILCSFLSNAQPSPNCSGTEATRKLFINSETPLMGMHLENASPTTLGDTSCYEVSSYYIKKDKRGYYFDLVIYDNMDDYDQEVWKHKSARHMRITLKGLELHHQIEKAYDIKFTYFLNIPMFYEGDYEINVSKLSERSNAIKVRCTACVENHYTRATYITAVNITPENWRKIKVKAK